MTGKALFEIVDETVDVKAASPMHRRKAFLDPQFGAVEIARGEDQSTGQNEGLPHGPVRINPATPTVISTAPTSRGSSRNL